MENQQLFLQIFFSLLFCDSAAMIEIDIDVDIEIIVPQVPETLVIFLYSLSLIQIV